MFLSGKNLTENKVDDNLAGEDAGVRTGRHERVFIVLHTIKEYCIIILTNEKEVF